MALGPDRGTSLIRAGYGLFLLFVGVPVVELLLLIEIGQHIGTLATLGLIAATGIVGAALARHQGLGALARLQRDLAEGRLPGEPLVDGVLILMAGAVLLTPGVLTDAAGFLLLVPPFRRLVMRFLTRRFEAAVRRGTLNVRVGLGGPGTPFERPMKNVTPPRRPDDHRDAH